MPTVTLPQFTEREAKIAGPLTFKQFISLIIIAGISGFVYLSLPRSFSLPLAIVILIGGSALIFVQIEKEPLYSILLKRFTFLFSSKTFFWGKGKLKTSLPSEVEIKKLKKDEIKTKRESRLKSLIVKLETKK
jgi:hypothetical protein